MLTVEADFNSPHSTINNQFRPRDKLKHLHYNPPRMTAIDTETLPAEPAPESIAYRPRRPHLDLFLISFLILFFELACIRWFGSTVVFLTFFTNIVLMACFLGMSVGCWPRRGGRISSAGCCRWRSSRSSLAMVDVQRCTRNTDRSHDRRRRSAESPQLIYFGTEYRANRPERGSSSRIEWSAGRFSR